MNARCSSKSCQHSAHKQEPWCRCPHTGVSRGRSISYSNNSTQEGDLGLSCLSGLRSTGQGEAGRRGGRTQRREWEGPLSRTQIAQRAQKEHIPPDSWAQTVACFRAPERASEVISSFRKGPEAHLCPRDRHQLPSVPGEAPLLPDKALVGDVLCGRCPWVLLGRTLLPMDSHVFHLP